jgi:hypothetical protein
VKDGLAVRSCVSSPATTRRVPRQRGRRTLPYRRHLWHPQTGASECTFQRVDELLAHGAVGEVHCSEHAAKRARLRYRLQQHSLAQIRSQLAAEARQALKEKRVSHEQPYWTILPGACPAKPEPGIRFAWDADERHVFCLLYGGEGRWLVKTVLLPTVQVTCKQHEQRAQRRQERLLLREQLAS